MGLDYKSAGVNVSLGDRCSQIAYEAAKKTFKNRKGKVGEAFTLKGGFSGPIQFEELKNAFIVMNSDGVGSKAVVAEKMNSFDSLAFDLIAMVADDCVALGAEPVALTNTLDLEKVNEKTVSGLMKGLVKASERAGIAVAGGEIAELPDQVKGFVWNADLIGALEKEKLVDGSKIEKGDAIVSIQSNGIRSNGMTLARRILEEEFGKKWHLKKFKGEKWGNILLKPSLIVSPAIIELVGGYGKKPGCEVHGLVHVTGGGLSNNLERIMKQKELSAVFDNLFPPHQEFLELMRLGKVNTKEAYNTWNMGNCFLIITPKPNKAIKTIKKHNLNTRIAGKIA